MTQRCHWIDSSGSSSGNVSRRERRRDENRRDSQPRICFACCRRRLNARPMSSVAHIKVVPRAARYPLGRAAERAQQAFTGWSDNREPSEQLPWLGFVSERVFLV